MNKQSIGHDPELIKLQKEFNKHILDTSNPHSVTKGTVGLSKVENLALDEVLEDYATFEYVDANAVKSMKVKQDFTKNEVVLMLQNGNGETIDSDPISLVSGKAISDADNNAFKSDYAYKIQVIKDSSNNVYVQLVAHDGTSLDEPQLITTASNNTINEDVNTNTESCTLTLLDNYNRFFTSTGSLQTPISLNDGEYDTLLSAISAGKHIRYKLIDMPDDSIYYMYLELNSPVIMENSLEFAVPYVRVDTSNHGIAYGRIVFEK